MLLQTFLNKEFTKPLQSCKICTIWSWGELASMIYSLLPRLQLFDFVSKVKAEHFKILVHCNAHSSCDLKWRVIYFSLENMFFNIFILKLWNWLIISYLCYRITITLELKVNGEKNLLWFSNAKRGIPRRNQIMSFAKFIKLWSDQWKEENKNQLKYFEHVLSWL